VQDPNAAAGQAVFQHNACISCHTIAGTVATGRFGPDLTHVASRDTIASGSVPNTPANIRAFVDNPAHFKPGVLMPPMHLNEHDLDLVTAYLTTLKYFVSPEVFNRMFTMHGTTMIFFVAMPLCSGLRTILCRS
jgi:cytochrome c oxidase subunit 2